ncbi:LptA/OstA family protein [Iodidimonas sp. SYSU 1G8]|uniref:LptA/OstA family protein n=1 Tax=Iodidimonas sp. SYSU 1G8 TaxID=3133967 RepID=UPI0031FF34E8
MPSKKKSLCLGLALALMVAPAAMAAQNGFSNHDAKDPIQFSADRLEVKKEGQVASFIGKVEAVQGDMTLLGDEVRVYYQDNPAGAGQAKSGLTGSVTRLDSRGNVRITSRGDTAEGDWAVYDIGRQLVTMGGRVVLRQGDSVVRGSRLEINLDSGKARFQGLPDLAGEQRVRGEFTPATGNKPATTPKQDR